jgi:hypothetical protein
VLTIGTGIAAGSKNAEAVGDAFWRLHAHRETSGLGRQATAEPTEITQSPG